MSELRRDYRAAAVATFWPRRSLAAFTVLLISMAMVSGPTPPGTGVMRPCNFGDFGINVAHQRRAILGERRFALGIAGEELLRIPQDR